jgi:hypothetical protein
MPSIQGGSYMSNPFNTAGALGQIPGQAANPATPANQAAASSVPLGQNMANANGNPFMGGTSSSAMLNTIISMVTSFNAAGNQNPNTALDKLRTLFGAVIMQPNAATLASVVPTSEARDEDGRDSESGDHLHHESDDRINALQGDGSGKGHGGAQDDNRDEHADEGDAQQ